MFSSSQGYQQVESVEKEANVLLEPTNEPVSSKSFDITYILSATIFFLTMALVFVLAKTPYRLETAPVGTFTCTDCSFEQCTSTMCGIYNYP